MKLFERGELKLLWPFYLDALLSTMLFFVPAFLIIYFLQLDLSLFQIGLIMSTASLTALIFEIPTGVVADLYGRKISVQIGSFIYIISLIWIYFAHDFYSILGAVALMGFASTFHSGASEAWTTDLINKHNKKLLQNFFIKQQSLDALGLIVAGLIGVFFVKSFGIGVIWPVAAAAFLVSIIILTFAKEEFKKRKQKSTQIFSRMKKQTKDSFNYSRRNSVISHMMFASIFMVIVGGLSSTLSWVPLLKELSFPEHAFGYIWSGIAFIAMIAPWFTKKYLHKNNEKNFIILSILSIGIITSLILFAETLPMVLFVLFGSLFFIEMKVPVQRIYFQKFIPSKLRATIGSIEGMIISLVSIVTAPLVGLLVDKIGPRYTIFASVFLVIPAAFIYFTIKEKKKTSKNT